jgi:hypothetical protein
MLFRLTRFEWHLLLIIRNTRCRTVTLESLNKNGVSTTLELGQEKYVTFIAGAFKVTEYFLYDYLHMDVELFYTVANTGRMLERRDEWLSKKELCTGGQILPSTFFHEVCRKRK